MKALKFITILGLISFSLFFAACNDGVSGSSNDTGTVAMSVTDAKPLLPEKITNLFVTFSEVWVHKPGEGWIELDLVEPEYTIDLYQFQDGSSTDLVLPKKLSKGKYTQVRIAVSKAEMIIENDDETTETLTLEIPSENLKTDKNFTIDLGDGSAMDIIIHFDLSMSIVVSGTVEEPVYKLKPVLHLFEDPVQAATIEGELDNSSFGNSEEKATIIVDSNGEVYTQVEVSQSTDGPTIYSIFWIVPNQ